MGPVPLQPEGWAIQWQCLNQGSGCTLTVLPIQSTRIKTHLGVQAGMADYDHLGSSSVLPHQHVPLSFGTIVLLLPGKKARHTRRHFPLGVA